MYVCVLNANNGTDHENNGTDNEIKPALTACATVPSGLAGEQLQLGHLGLAARRYAAMRDGGRAVGPREHRQRSPAHRLVQRADGLGCASAHSS